MMPQTPSQVYETLQAQLDNGEMTELQRKIYQLLRDHPEGLGRPDLIEAIYGYRPATIDGNTDDRKIRKAIEALRRRLFPIVSNSGAAGYRLDVSREGVTKMVRELQSRRDRLNEQITAAMKFYEIPMEFIADPATTGSQMEMAL